jgi:uncharacterized membrane-anchored protein
VVKLRRGSKSARPGLVRTARVDRRVEDLIARARPGDIAVIDVIDLDRGTAEQLVAARVAAVVNAAPSSSGRYPVRGPQTLLEAGIPLVDAAGGEVFAKVRDGDTVRLDGSAVYASGRLVVDGTLQTDETVAASREDAVRGVQLRLGALVADAGRRLDEDGARLLEGDGFPPLQTPLRDEVVVIIAAAATAHELRTARRLVRDRRGIVIAIGAGADTARAARLRPDLIVIGRGCGMPSTFARAHEVLVLDGADQDNPVPTGIPRARAGSVGSAEDTAALIAHTRGAALVVTCGTDESVGGVLDRSVAAGSAPLLAQMRGGGRHLSATAYAAAKDRRGRVIPATVTIAAVAALALVGGVVLGAGPLDAVLDRSGERQAEAQQVDALEQARARAASSDAVVAALAPGLVEDALAGRAVTVVVLPGANLPDSLLDALGESGADVAEPLVLEEDYVNPRRTRVLRDLALQIAPAGQRTELEAEATGSDPAAQLDEVLARAIASTESERIGTTDPSTTTVLTGLGRIGALAEPARAPRVADLIVLVAPPASGLDTAVREATLAGALAEASVGTVVVTRGREGRGASSGVLSALRGEGGAPAAATVDVGDQPAGRLAVVLALREAVLGRPAAHYGTAADADAVIPTLTGTASPD